MTNHSQSSRIILRVTIVGVVTNIILTAMKVSVGFFFGNLAVVSDAATNLAAVIASILTIFAISLARPDRDKKYNYGHERVEPLIVLLLSAVLFVIGCFFAWQGVRNMFNPHSPEINAYLIGVIVLSIVVQECTFRYVMYNARKIESEILKVDAWHSRIDGLASVAVLLGLIASIIWDTNIFENIAVVVVALFIFGVAFNIFRPALYQLTDRAASDKACERITKYAEKQEGVIKVDHLRTRVFGSQIYVDMVIVVDANLTTAESYTLGGRVHDALRANSKLRIKDCVVVVKPDVLA